MHILLYLGMKGVDLMCIRLDPFSVATRLPVITLIMAFVEHKI